MVHLRGDSEFEFEIFVCRFMVAGGFGFPWFAAFVMCPMGRLKLRIWTYEMVLEWTCWPLAETIIGNVAWFSVSRILGRFTAPDMLLHSGQVYGYFTRIFD